MKIRNLLFALSALLLLSSCWDDENDDPKFPEGEEVNFRSSIAGQVSRAEGDVWHVDDAIGIFMWNTNNPATNIFAENMHYKTPGTGSFSPVNESNRIYYPATGEPVDFVSYYPHSTIADLTYKVDVSKQADQAAIDLLYSNNAKNKTKVDKLIELNFLHQLSKVVFKITPGEGLTQDDLDNLEVSIDGFDTKTDFLLESGLLSDQSTTPAIIETKTTIAGKLYESIVIPTTVDATQVVFDLKNPEGDKFLWNIPTDTKFEKGKKHTYTVTIKRTDITVVGTIEDWVDGTGGEVIAD